MAASQINARSGVPVWPVAEECCCALHEVTSPDQMITSQIVIAFGFAPGDTHRRNERALKNFIFMRQQHTTAESIHSASIGGVGAEVEFRIHNCALPLADIRLTM